MSIAEAAAIDTRVDVLNACCNSIPYTKRILRETWPMFNSSPRTSDHRQRSSSSRNKLPLQPFRNRRSALLAREASPMYTPAYSCRRSCLPIPAAQRGPFGPGRLPHKAASQYLLGSPVLFVVQCRRSAAVFSPAPPPCPALTPQVSCTSWASLRATLSRACSLSNPEAWSQNCRTDLNSNKPFSGSAVLDHCSRSGSLHKRPLGMALKLMAVTKLFDLPLSRRHRRLRHPHEHPYKLMLPASTPATIQPRLESSWKSFKARTFWVLQQHLVLVMARSC